MFFQLKAIVPVVMPTIFTLTVGLWHFTILLPTEKNNKVKGVLTDVGVKTKSDLNPIEHIMVRL